MATYAQDAQTATRYLRDLADRYDAEGLAEAAGSARECALAIEHDAEPVRLRLANDGVLDLVDALGLLIASNAVAADAEGQPAAAGSAGAGIVALWNDDELVNACNQFVGHAAHVLSLLADRGMPPALADSALRGRLARALVDAREPPNG